MTGILTPAPRLAVNGVHLNVKMMGVGEPLVMLHGFTGSAKSWSPHVQILRQHYFCVSIDLLGHGGSDSPVDPARYRMDKIIGDLIGVLNQLGLDKINLLGYSMGGRVALGLAITHPSRINTLVLESASPGIKDPTDRNARVLGDEGLATLLEQDGIEKFVESWGNLPLFASQKRLPQPIQDEIRKLRLNNNVRGLANSLRGLGTGVQPSYWDKLGSLTVPTLLVAGELDKKYVSIANQMAQFLPKKRVAIVPDAGHTIHVEQPAVFDKLVLDFLAEYR